MSTCDHCGGHVSEQFARVFADDAGTVRACPNCAPTEAIGRATRRRARAA
jgi:hypothetical protein